MQILTRQDADLDVLEGATLAVVGYGNQGQAHARNLRDSGHRVIVAQRPGGASHALAVEHGFQPVTAREAAEEADLLILALPDESAASVFQEEIAPVLRAGQALGFLHGLNIRFGLIQPPPDVDVILVAPKGPGRLLRSRYEQGRGLAALIAVHQDATGRARDRAIAWAVGLGADRAAMIATTFADECETDLFGEQAVLCGGVVELMKAAFDVLVETGYPPELAYIECIHEVKQIVDLVYEQGLEAMRRRISGTARYGGLTRGPRLAPPAIRGELRRILEEIRSGQFAKEWTAECAAGQPKLSSLLASERHSASEQAGRIVRTWLADTGDAGVV